MDSVSNLSSVTETLTIQDSCLSPLFNGRIIDGKIELLSSHQVSLLSPFVLGLNRQKKRNGSGSVPSFDLSIHIIPDGSYMVMINIRTRYNVYGDPIEQFGPISDFAHIRLILQAFLEMESELGHKHNCVVGNIERSNLVMGENMIRYCQRYVAQDELVKKSDTPFVV